MSHDKSAVVLGTSPAGAREPRVGPVPERVLRVTLEQAACVLDRGSAVTASATARPDGSWSVGGASVLGGRTRPPRTASTGAGPGSPSDGEATAHV